MEPVILPLARWCEQTGVHLLPHRWALEYVQSLGDIIVDSFIARIMDSTVKLRHLRMDSSGVRLSRWHIPKHNAVELDQINSTKTVAAVTAVVHLTFDTIASSISRLSRIEVDLTLRPRHDDRWRPLFQLQPRVNLTGQDRARCHGLYNRSTNCGTKEHTQTFCQIMSFPFHFFFHNPCFFHYHVASGVNITTSRSVTLPKGVDRPRSPREGRKRFDQPFCAKTRKELM